MNFRRSILLISSLLLIACDSEGGSTNDPSSDVAADVAGEPDVDVTPDPPAPVVFGILSDTHVCGALDHHVSQNMIATLEELDGRDPRPAFVAITGDLIDSMPGCASEQGIDPLDTFLAIVEGSPLPIEPVAGNHDYYGAEGPYEFVVSQDIVDDRYHEKLGIPAYRAEIVTGVKFIYLNSMNGPLWDLSLGLNGSYGPEQLAWLDQELGDGVPAVLFAHHPPSLVSELDGDPTLEDILALHPGTALALFTGHLHIFARGVEPDGTSLYLTADTQLGNGYHYVRVDPETKTVEILNEDEIDYGEVEDGGCVVDEVDPVGDTAAFVDSIQQIVLTGLEADASSLAPLIEEGLAEMPLIVRVGAFDETGMGFSGELISGTQEGEAGDVLPPYVAANPAWPCIPMAFLFDDPCFETQPVGLALDFVEIVDYDFPDGWQIRLALENFRLEGRLVGGDAPHFADGILTMEADLGVFADDVLDIAVMQYCDGNADCKPGENGNPECPEGADGSFYEQLPTSCNIEIIEGFTAKMILALVDGVPNRRISLVGSFATRVPDVAEEAEAGAVAPDLFMACQ